MTARPRYGLADAFLTEPAVSPPASSATATSRTLLSDEPSHSFEVGQARMITGELAPGDPRWLYGTLQAMHSRFGALPGRDFGSIRPTQDFAIIGGAGLLGGVLGYSSNEAGTEANAGPVGGPNPTDRPFVVYGALDAALLGHANVCTYVSGPLPTAAASIDTSVRAGVFGIAGLKDQVSNVVEPLRRLTEQLQQKRLFDAPVEVRVLAELALRRLGERRDEDVDQWARRLIDGLPDAE